MGVELYEGNKDKEVSHLWCETSFCIVKRQPPAIAGGPTGVILLPRKRKPPVIE